MLLLAPYVASRPHASPAGTAFVLAVYGIGGLICHQLPERSYHLWAAQMPVCARCAGIYFGAAIAAIAAAAFGARGSPAAIRSPACIRSKAEDERLALLAPRLTLVISALPTVLTLVYEWTTGHMPAHWIRFAAGVSIGVAVAWLAIEYTHHRRAGRPEPVEG
jgi:hypothetical protein